MQIVVIGGGVLGTMHAVEAVKRGHQVVHLEREPEARGASVRNFGLIWVSGRSAVELPETLRARELWEELGERIPGIGFRPRGSLTVLRTDAEVAVAKEAASRPDAGHRGFELLDAHAARERNPALRGEFLAALWCAKDASVESRVALPAIREQLLLTDRYRYLPNRTALRITGSTTVEDDQGDRHSADLVVFCPGAALGGLATELTGGMAVRRVRLQMMQTEPLGEPLTTAFADGDSLRYYPGFAGAALERLRAEEPQQPVAAAHHMQLLCVQRADGGLTIGDTHSYDEPFPFDLDEAPYDYLATVVTELLGRPLPRVRRRWAGVYAQSLDPDEVVVRREVQPGLWIVTGPGGRGMTLSPAIAERTADLADL
ncbi:TIGR03364 family FAD-dependent oxidoreductase [Pseudonocardia spinosispora]|uniref:TIGR03364 family FAD-dependent oxidoreductase n=1 Tax=Pseudonocardia spinosispora TaxID=103441 RepID=UPI000404369E|nr:TIGR03364 family FAD-dependent oxidoreductase [Pseudonocardia spinosispora]